MAFKKNRTCEISQDIFIKIRDAPSRLKEIVEINYQIKVICEANDFVVADLLTIEKWQKCHCDAVDKLKMVAILSRFERKRYFKLLLIKNNMTEVLKEVKSADKVYAMREMALEAIAELQNEI